MIIQHPSETTKMTSRTEVRPSVATRETLPCQDLRKVGLQSIGERLSASRGDLNLVFEARAKADVVYCPVCPLPHPVA